MSPFSRASDRRVRVIAAAVFAVLSLVLVVAGRMYFQSETKEITRDKYQALAAIGSLKASQIEQWRKGRLAEIERAAKDLHLVKAVENFLSAPDAHDAESELRECLKLELGDDHPTNILLLDPQANLLFAIEDSHKQVPETTRETVRATLSNKKAKVSGFFVSGNDTLQVDAAAVVQDSGGKPLAVLIKRSHEADNLLSLLTFWPTDSQSTETLLIQKDAQEVILLNKLRKAALTGKNQRLPLTPSGPASVQSALGRQGQFEGRDYSGVEVLSDLRSIPDSPWFVVSKVDRQEILADAHYRAVIFSLILGLIMLLSTVMVALFYRQRQVRIARDLIRAEREHSEMHKNYRLLFEHMAEGAAVCQMLFDKHGEVQDWIYLSVNGMFETLTGLKGVTGKRVSEVIPGLRERDAKLFEIYTRVTRTGKPEKFEMFVESLQQWYSISVFSHQKDCVGVVFDDITARKHSEIKTLRLTQLYAALSHSNQAVVHAASPEELLSTICRVAVEFGGMSMAWIGRTDEATGKIRKVHAFGRGTDYLDGIEISLDSNDPYGLGPTGTATREGRPVWCQDFQNDPCTTPWHERGAAYGWRSSAAIPLTIEGKVIGALTLTSHVPHAFDEEARKLLIEMAEDVSFGWEKFIREEERRQAEEELKNLRTAVEQSANTVIITNSNGQIEYVNPAFEKSTGFTAAESVGKNPRILKSGKQDPAFYQNLWETITSGKIWRGEFQNRRKDGSLYWEVATISPVHSSKGEIIHFIAVKEDITDRKALESHLLEALDLAEAGSRAKSEFLAVMSHELRTPLNGVLGFAELLSDTSLNDEQSEYARTIINSGSHLLQIVNDILDFSSIEKGSLRFETGPVVLEEIVESSCVSSRKAAAEKGIAFRTELDPRVPEQILGDSRRICQILINLIANAVKFTAVGSVVLRVSPGSADGTSCLEFSVHDTGIGMTPETIGQLFKPFSQADSKMNRQFEGTGLGLAISQRLAEAMGGKITVVSTPGQGSTFTLHLPLDASRTGRMPAMQSRLSDLEASPSVLTALLSTEQTNEPPTERKKVLIVEDDPNNSLLAGKMIESLGYRAEYAANGQEALAAFRTGSFSAILMDMLMPVLDGLSATRMIRDLEAPSGTRVPIIALTANVLPNHKKICLAAGMDDYLSKPFKKAQLAEKLSRFLQTGGPNT